MTKGRIRHRGNTIIKIKRDLPVFKTLQFLIELKTTFAVFGQSRNTSSHLLQANFCSRLLLLLLELILHHGKNRVVLLGKRPTRNTAFLESCRLATFNVPPMLLLHQVKVSLESNLLRLGSNQFPLQSLDLDFALLLCCSNGLQLTPELLNSEKMIPDLLLLGKSAKRYSIKAAYSLLTSIT